jgi:photosystem II stability/assembly factor-like uncharacterized protein
MKPQLTLSLAAIVCVLLVMLWAIPRPSSDRNPNPSEVAAKPWKTWRPGGVPRGDGPGQKPDDWFLRQRAYPYADVPEPARRNALSEALAFRTMQALGAPAVGGGAWQQAGPLNVHGRITSIAVHPGYPNTVYIGSADGGVFKSTDGGSNWTPIFDHAPSLSIGAVAVSPTGPDTLYVGTGEANAAGDTYAGDGLWRTTDGGSSWEHLGLEATAKIGRIAVDPTDPDRIFVAAMGRLFSTNPERGLYRSLDGGSNWTQVLFLNDSTGVVDVAIDPQNPNMIYAAAWERIRSPTHRQVGGFASGIHKSTNGGDTWTLLDATNGLPALAADNGRIGLTIAASQSSTVYAYYINHPGQFMGIYKTTDAGAIWSRVDDGSISDVTSSFGWYFGQIRADPTDPDKVFVLGVPLYRSADGGSTWSSVGGSMHVDHHALWIDPGNPNHIYAGNDGGFHESTNGGSSWTKTGELPITQFYAITVDELRPWRLYGGTQDNSTCRTKTGGLADWDVIYVGDGFYTLVDPRDSKVIYAEYQFGGLAKSTNTGAQFSSALNGIPVSDRRNWSRAGHDHHPRRSPLRFASGDGGNGRRQRLGDIRQWIELDQGLRLASRPLGDPDCVRPHERGRRLRDFFRIQDRRVAPPHLPHRGRGRLLAGHLVKPAPHSAERRPRGSGEQEHPLRGLRRRRVLERRPGYELAAPGDRAS